MFMAYLWQKSPGMSGEDAYNRFSSVLTGQAFFYEQGFGAHPLLKIKKLGNVHIGQLHYDHGLDGWQSWADHGYTGLLWSGVCENYLGRKMDARTVDEVISVLENNPAEIGGWDGMFSVIAWRGRKTFFASSAAMSPSLWHTEGPDGWALGPRAAPILELAGHGPEPDMDALSLYLSYGFFVGGRSAFRRVARVADRQQIVLEQNSKPEFRTYLSIPGYLGCGRPEHDRNESVSLAAGRLVQRVATQIKHSPNPVVLLTAGRDSRSIAAAAKQTGYHFLTQTSGPACSEDVVIAAQVSKAMGLEHRHAGDFLSTGALCACPEAFMARARLWLQMSEGIIPVNYCLHLKDFFYGRRKNFQGASPSGKSQFFHGVEPGLAHGIAYAEAGAGNIRSMALREVHRLFTFKNRFLRSNAGAGELLEDTFTGLDNILRETGGGTRQWIGLYWWRERGLVLGADVQSAYSPVRWAWLPLFDRELTKVAWNFTFEEKISNQFFSLDVMKKIAPELANIPFSLHDPEKAAFALRAKRKIMAGLRHYLNKTGIRRLKKGADSHGEKLWERVFLDGREHFWPEFIEKKNLLKLIHLDPANDLLWNLATVELLSDALFLGNGEVEKTTKKAVARYGDVPSGPGGRAHGRAVAR